MKQDRPTKVSHFLPVFWILDLHRYIRSFEYINDTEAERRAGEGRRSGQSWGMRERCREEHEGEYRPGSNDVLGRVCLMKRITCTMDMKIH